MLYAKQDNNFTNNFFNTIGVDFKMKSINLSGKEWDTAGQERFRTITCNYYHGAHGIIVVYDITDQESFNAVKEWMEEIQKYAQSDVIKIIVGNKRDQEENRVISYEQGKQLADSYKVEFFETSAKETYMIDDTFNTIAESIITQMNKQPQKTTNSELHITQIGNRQNVGNNCCG